MDKHHRDALSAKMNAILGEAQANRPYGSDSDRAIEMECETSNPWAIGRELSFASNPRGSSIDAGIETRGNQSETSFLQENNAWKGWSPLFGGSLDGFRADMECAATSSCQDVRGLQGTCFLQPESWDSVRNIGRMQDALNPTDMKPNWEDAHPPSDREACNAHGPQKRSNWADIAGMRHWRAPLQETEINKQRGDENHWGSSQFKDHLSGRWQKAPGRRAECNRYACEQENTDNPTSWRSGFPRKALEKGVGPHPKSTIVVNKVNRNIYVHEVNSYTASSSSLAGSTPAPSIAKIIHEKHGSETNDSEKRQARVYVGGISESLTKDEIHSHFEQWGTVVEICFPMEKNSHTKRRGFCFVNYEDKGSAQRAVDSSPLVIAGKPIQSITYALDKEEIVKQRIVQLLEKMQEQGQSKCRIDQLGNAFRDEYGCPLDFKKFGHQKLISLLVAIPELRVSGGLVDGGGMRFVELKITSKSRVHERFNFAPQTPSTCSNQLVRPTSATDPYSPMNTSAFVYPQSPAANPWSIQHPPNTSIWKEIPNDTKVERGDEETVSHLLPSSLYEDLSWLPQN